MQFTAFRHAMTMFLIAFSIFINHFLRANPVITTILIPTKYIVDILYSYVKYDTGFINLNRLAENITNPVKKNVIMISILF